MTGEQFLAKINRHPAAHLILPFANLHALFDDLPEDIADWPPEVVRESDRRYGQLFGWLVEMEHRDDDIRERAEAMTANED